jgi:hypothetical protein
MEGTTMETTKAKAIAKGVLLGFLGADKLSAALYREMATAMEEAFEHGRAGDDEEEEAAAAA